MLHHVKQSIRRRVLVVPALMIACGGANVIGPSNQLEVNSATDNFQFQVSNLENVTQTLNYSWTNTGTQAVVDISPGMTAGSAMLTITDADGTVVYQADLADDMDGDTSVGVAGDWSIDLQLDGVDGTLNFRVQRKT